MRGRGGDEQGSLDTPEPRLKEGDVYRIEAPSASLGVWNGMVFVAISRATDKLIETQGRAIVRVGRIEDSNVRLTPFAAVSCSYCGGNLEQDDSGQWVSVGACSCSPPSPFKPENRALKSELEDLTLLDP